jgi:hypothetical protein
MDINGHSRIGDRKVAHEKTRHRTTHKDEFIAQRLQLWSGPDKVFRSAISPFHRG